MKNLKFSVTYQRTRREQTCNIKVVQIHWEALFASGRVCVNNNKCLHCGTVLYVRECVLCVSQVGTLFATYSLPELQ